MKIFWSWQSDTPGKIGRFLVRDVLKDAVEQLKQAPEIEDAVREQLHVDHDIENVAGSPDIARTILRKIEESQVFVADVTIVGEVLRDGTTDDHNKTLINSNVAIELGYALRALSDENLLLVFNEHYGSHADLPFDLRHKGGAITFDLAPDAERTTIEEQKKKLKGHFVRALRPYLSKQVKAMASTQETKPVFNNAAYFQSGEVLTPNGLLYRSPRLCYLRLIPASPLVVLLELAKLKEVVLNAPLLRDDEYLTKGHTLNKFGAIAYTSSADQTELTASTQLFRNGELWCISNTLIRTDPNEVPEWVKLPFIAEYAVEKTYVITTRRLMKYLEEQLQIGPSWILEVGLANIEGLYLNLHDGQPHGPIQQNEVVHRGTVDNGNSDPVLLSFFNQVYDSVGERRPPNLNGFPAPPTAPES
jgi:hypothetical protein